MVKTILSVDYVIEESEPPNLVVTVTGLITGLGLGLMFHPMLQSAD